MQNITFTYIFLSEIKIKYGLNLPILSILNDSFYYKKRIFYVIYSIDAQLRV